MKERNITKVVIIVLLIIGIIFASGCLRAKVAPKTITPTPGPEKNISIGTETSKGKVVEPSNVRVAIVYETVTDGGLYGRSNAYMINILKQTNTSFIFRGFWRWLPVPESKASAPTEISNLGGSPSELNYILNSGYTYENLKSTISEIKKEMPNTIFVSAIPAQKIRGIEKNDLTGEILNNDKTYEMAFDPAKWGMSISKEEAQKQAGNRLGWSFGVAYYPDITNPNYQKFLTDMAKKQIDSGADAVWIDMLFSQASLIKEVTKDSNHAGIKESFEASSKIVDEIHEYGRSKGKTILVGSWDESVDYQYQQPKLDFVTLSPKTIDISNRNFDHQEWSNKYNIIREKLGNIPIYVFIDWANEDSPIVTFSQKLTKTEQKTYLQNAYKFFKDEGMIFVFPVHGGFMGNNAKKLSFGQKVYDSEAPDFATFDTTVTLTNS